MKGDCKMAGEEANRINDRYESHKIEAVGIFPQNSLWRPHEASSRQETTVVDMVCHVSQVSLAWRTVRQVQW